MSRNTRRGKGVRDQSHDDGLVHEPAAILSSILKVLNLTFERDIGLLNGRNVRSLPEKSALTATKVQLEKLRKALEKIQASDEENINLITDVQAEIAKKGKDKQTDLEKNRSDIGKRSQKNDIENFSGKRPLEPENGELGVDSIESNLMVDDQVQKKRRLEEDQIENDPNIRNPKSEFVISQTLPLAAMRLGLFQEDGLETTGEDYLKRKYGVVSYPTNDLKELLPGEIPDMDFSKPKPTNQIQFNTFLSSVDAFFREFTEDDTKFLQSKYILPQNLQFVKSYEPEISPYTIPKLGPLYTEIWMKEDNNQNIANLTPPPLSDPNSILPRKSGKDISDSCMESEEVSCGPLVSRLLSAILKDDENVLPKEENPGGLNCDSFVGTPMSEPETNSPSSVFSLPKIQDHGWLNSNSNIDYASFEERLKRELKYVGIYTNLPKEVGKSTEDPDWLTGREDDEISAELRELQSTLQNVTTRNIKRKSMLIPLLEKQLAWQEYCSILENLDKQVDQAYIKRIRAPKNKKKKQQTPGPELLGNGSTSQAAIQAAHQQAANSSLKSLLDKRQRWISKIGPLFDKPEIMKRIPRESVFKDFDQEEEEEDADVFSNGGTGKEEELSEPLEKED